MLYKVRLRMNPHKALDSYVHNTLCFPWNIQRTHRDYKPLNSVRKFYLVWNKQKITNDQNYTLYHNSLNQKEHKNEISIDRKFPHITLFPRRTEKNPLPHSLIFVWGNICRRFSISKMSAHSCSARSSAKKIITR